MLHPSEGPGYGHGGDMDGPFAGQVPDSGRGSPTDSERSTYLSEDVQLFGAVPCIPDVGSAPHRSSSSSSLDELQNRPVIYLDFVDQTPPYPLLWWLQVKQNDDPWWGRRQEARRYEPRYIYGDPDLQVWASGSSQGVVSGTDLGTLVPQARLSGQSGVAETNTAYPGLPQAPSAGFINGVRPIAPRVQPNSGQENTPGVSITGAIRTPLRRRSRETRPSENSRPYRNASHDTEYHAGYSRFCCPFVKRHRDEYRSVFNTCTQPPGFKDISGVKEHLKRYHWKERRCDKCFRIFWERNQRRELPDHRLSCTGSERYGEVKDFEWMSEQQVRVLEMKCGSQEDFWEQWEKMYRRLFPEVGIDIPTPCYDVYVWNDQPCKKAARLESQAARTRMEDGCNVDQSRIPEPSAFPAVEQQLGSCDQLLQVSYSGTRLDSGYGTGERPQQERPEMQAPMTSEFDEAMWHIDDILAGDGQFPEHSGDCQGQQYEMDMRN